MDSKVDKTFVEVKIDGSEETGQITRFQVAKVNDVVSGENDLNSSINSIKVDNFYIDNDSNNNNDECEDEKDGDYSEDFGPQQTDNLNNYYDTKNLRSFRYYTREALPRMDHYRNVLSVTGHMTRPTLDELHGVQATVVTESRKKVSSSLAGNLRTIHMHFLGKQSPFDL